MNNIDWTKFKVANKKTNGKNLERAKNTYIKFIEALECLEYELLSEYENTRKKVCIRCNRGHETEVIPHNIYTCGTRCRICANQNRIRR